MVPWGEGVKCGAGMSVPGGRGVCRPLRSGASTLARKNIDVEVKPSHRPGAPPSRCPAVPVPRNPPQEGRTTRYVLHDRNICSCRWPARSSGRGPRPKLASGPAASWFSQVAGNWRRTGGADGSNPNPRRDLSREKLQERARRCRALWSIFDLFDYSSSQAISSAK